MALKGHEGTGIQEFSRPSGICCDDDGRVVVADSKNQRVMIFSPLLDFLLAVSSLISFLLSSRMSYSSSIPIYKLDFPFVIRDSFVKLHGSMLLLFGLNVHERIL